MLKDVSVVVVNTSEPHLCVESLEELCAFYSLPTLLISQPPYCAGHEGTISTALAAHKNVRHVVLPIHFGIGPALHAGFLSCSTKYVFSMSSDCLIVKPNFLEDMLSLMNEDSAATYGVGAILSVGYVGKPVDPKTNKEFFQCLHPMFSLYNLDMYKTLPPFVHHPVPGVINAMHAKARGLYVRDFPYSEYVTVLSLSRSTEAKYWDTSLEV